MEMNPPQKQVAQEHAQRLGQFLIQLDDDWPVQQILQLDWMPRVESAGCRTKRERPQNSQATVLPQHSSALELHSLQFLRRIEEVGILLPLSIVESKLLEFLVERLNQNVGYAWAGKVRFFQRLRHGADPSLGMHPRRPTQRIPMKRH